MVKDDITGLIDRAAQDLEYLVYDFSIFLQGEKSKITVRIDHLKGVTLKDCENYSNHLSELLDEAELLPNYSLEISSPGVKREIRSLEEFVRFMEAPVKVICEIDGDRKVFNGTVSKISDNNITLSTEREEIEVSFDNIIKANLDY